MLKECISPSGIRCQAIQWVRMNNENKQYDLYCEFAKFVPGLNPCWSWDNMYFKFKSSLGDYITMFEGDWLIIIPPSKSHWIISAASFKNWTLVNSPEDKVAQAEKALKEAQENLKKVKEDALKVKNLPKLEEALEHLRKAHDILYVTPYVSGYSVDCGRLVDNVSTYVKSLKK